VLYVYSIWRNEVKLAPYFLRHYSTVANRIFIFDDNSNDGTRELLLDHPKVTVLSMTQPWLKTKYKGGIDDSYFRHLHELAYRQYIRDSDVWIACVDADEFIYDPILLDKLTDFTHSGINVVFCEGWSMVHPTFPTTSGQIYSEITTGIPDFWCSKPCLFRSDYDMKFRLGRHGVLEPKGMHIAAGHGVKLLHYRYLGADYSLARNQRNVSRMTDKNKNALLGRHNLDGSTYQHSLAWVEANRDKIQYAL